LTGSGSIITAKKSWVGAGTFFPHCSAGMNKQKRPGGPGRWWYFGSREGRPYEPLGLTSV
jgi:hypothetical protein